GNQLYIQASYPNASPRDVEEKVSRKIEDIVGTVPGVKKVHSYSRTSWSSVRVEFQTGTNLRDAYAQLSDRIDRVKPLLPDDVDRINVYRFDQNDRPMMNLVAAVPADMDNAAYRMENFVKPALQRIEGVGTVEMWGIQSRQVQVELLDERLRSHRIEPSQMLATLRGQNLTQSGGYVFEAGKKIYVRSLGRFESAEQIASLIIDPARRLRLSDVANVSFKLPSRDWMFRVDGKPAIGVSVTRESTGNIERISREVRATMAELQAMPQLAGMKFEVFSDQGKEVRDSIRNLEEAGLWGGAFAALIIFVFLRTVRMTGILTLAIPLSLLCTIVVLFFMGWTLNMATMMGLLLAVGMVVDNAIVIVENIYRQRQEGVAASAASINGAGEVGLAVVMSTCTNIIVFLPLMLMGGVGEMAFWMLRIGVPVIASLAASLFIALVFVPLAAQRLSRGRRHDELRAVRWLRRHYLGALGWVLRHPVNGTLLVLIAAGFTWHYYRTNPLQRPNYYQGIGGGGGETSMWMFFELPSGGTLDDADVFFRSFETFLQGNKERYNVARIETRFRYNNGQVQMKFREDPNKEWYRSAWNSFLVWMDWRKLPMDRIAIEMDIKEKFRFPPGINARSLQRGSSAPQDANMSISLYGEDTATLIALADEAVRRLRLIPGLVSVDSDQERAGNELQIQVDRDRARRLGINPQSIQTNISNTMRGSEVGRFNAEDGREMRVFAQLGDVDRAGLDDLRSMTFRTDGNVEVPLESIANLHVAKTLGQIQREGRQTIMRISARAPRVDSRGLFAAVDKAMEGFDMPRGYRWDKGSYYNPSESDAQIVFALWLAVIFVFLLMGILFESFVLPLAVISAVPLAFLGVYWILYFTDTPFDNMAKIGVVILVGVVVNNAIVLVDMANRLRAAGRARFDALLEAGRHRLRPIVMTSLCTVSGLIPMALGNSKIGGMPYAPLGRTMIGGLVVSTVLTLVIVPLFYTLLDELRGHTANVLRSAWGRGGGAGAGPVAGGGAAGVGRAGREE
ncbi:MAG: efflux RND transporter permease subunit, partial [Verrucomicrobia bacterium]|nr:efflux RND transporter permease subunit [Verrucomicrobiota bacterium]